MSGFEVEDRVTRYSVTRQGNDIFVFHCSEIDLYLLREFVDVLNAETDPHIIRDWNGTDAPYWIG